MSKELVSRWISKLPEKEKDLPLLIVDGIVYTPRFAVEQILTDAPAGPKLQSLIEQRSFGTSYSDEQMVAKLRLTEIMRVKPDRPLFATLSGKVFTPSQLLTEIQNDTDIGRQWVNTEIQHMQKILSVR